ncbi:3,4-dihydroxy-2-butanone-4-phosphate synthase [Nocardia huaxiensis]|uniref:3,4-dihydroxy-2-butanone 4-phosphate synthase n=1 Tax=Nocardia huaxiensis TaxID=2755382 RepID=A0A7D6VFT5_9NOCA|nr:3,4-dihydroxy-2-butanone-4-phosphate synthase [Nocardia huaxiensis]QLY28630.1 3,4-dihydroxy-2-butanone-4-phosphate synthase [Nocardia huaxiensis]UFS97899.1 3,4-dihydroxy-2-butanone-4-phosphate synthase [Nocardia huaxiensis]
MAVSPSTQYRVNLFDDLDAAISEIAAGRAVIAVDDEHRENEGDLIMAAELATPEQLGFFIRYTGGVVCAPMPADHADRLGLPPMCAAGQDRNQTAFTITVDAVEGVVSGISAADRAATLRALADPGTGAGDLQRPGHVFPLRAHPRGLAARQGHTEAGVELMRLAGLSPVAVISEVCHDDGSVMRLPALRAFADTHGLKLISIDQLVARQATTRMAGTVRA